MPGFIERVLAWLGAEPDQAAAGEGPAPHGPAGAGPRDQETARRSRVVPLAAVGAGGSTAAPVTRGAPRLVVCEPAGFDDVQAIADHLRAQRPVVVSLKNTERETARRIIDFLSGVVFAVEGSMRRVSDDIILCAPGGVDVQSEGKRLE